MEQAEKITFYNNQGEIELFESCFKLKLPLLLKGPTGCGKSQLVEFMARKLDRPLIKVVCNEDTNASDLIGRFLLVNGETVWQDGPVTRALKTDSILYLDEFAEAREDVIVVLHSLTDQRKEIYIDKLNETVKANSQFMLVASYNPGYQRGSRELKPSTKQRFVSLAMTYLDQKKEAQLIHELTGVSEKIAEKLAKIGNSIRTKEGLFLKETVSTRLLINAAQLIHGGVPNRKACHLAISEALADDRSIIEGINDFIDLSI